MGLNSSIQFRDIESVAEAFKNRAVEAWSVNCGKQFMFKGIGYDAFEAVLNTLDTGDSNATYTVKVYEDIDNAKEIKSNTPDDGSFNFKLNNEIAETYSTIKRMGGGHFERSSIAAIAQKLESIEARLDDESKPHDDSLGLVGKLMEHPQIGPIIAGIAPVLVDLVVNALTGVKPGVKPAATLPATQQQQPATFARNAALNGIDEDKLINETVEALKAYDPMLLQHLQKLLTIAQADPHTFSLIIKALD